MALQALPRRVASPPALIPTRSSGRLATRPPCLWPNLSAETQKQIARTMAELIRRMQTTDGTAAREMARADRLEGR
jgi:hypothetical protein